MLFTVAGSQFSIGGPFDPGTEVVTGSDFAAPWVPIGSVESLGTLAEESSTFDTTHLGGTRRTVGKGNRAAADMEITCGLDLSDAGQLALLAAERSTDAFGFRLALPGGSVRRFVGLVTQVAEIFEDASSVARLSVAIIRNSNLVRE